MTEDSQPVDEPICTQRGVHLHRVFFDGNEHSTMPVFVYKVDPNAKRLDEFWTIERIERWSIREGKYVDTERKQVDSISMIEIGSRYHNGRFKIVPAASEWEMTMQSNLRMMERL